jgi:ADP-heptose:LPS heptosyltransferase
MLRGNSLRYKFLVMLEEALNRFLLVVAFLVRGTPSRAGSQRRVLIAKLDSMGDFVLFTATLGSYRTIFPDAKLVLLVRDSFAELAIGCPDIDEVWPLNVRRFRRDPLERLRWFWRLCNFGFDVAINAVYSTNFRFLDCIVGWTLAPRRITHQCLDKLAPRLRNGPYYTELVPTTEELKFEVERNIEALRYLGFMDDRPKRTQLWTEKRPPLDRTRERQASRPTAVIVPGAASPIRRWSESNFVNAIVQIDKLQSFQWVLIGNADEVLLCDRIAASLRNAGISCENLAGKTTIAQIADILQNARFCLANETGPAHIAAALHVQTVCIVGGGHFRRFMTPDYMPNLRLIYHVLPCFHCSWNCTQGRPRCIEDISVESVVSASSSMIEEFNGRR